MDPELLPRGLERAHLPGARHEHPRAQPAIPRGQCSQAKQGKYFTQTQKIFQVKVGVAQQDINLIWTLLAGGSCVATVLTGFVFKRSDM